MGGNQRRGDVEDVFLEKLDATDHPGQYLSGDDVGAADDITLRR